jgi:hypothetical protein
MSQQIRCWTVKHPRNHHHKDWTAASTTTTTTPTTLFRLLSRLFFVPPIITTVFFCTYCPRHCCRPPLTGTGRGAKTSTVAIVPAMSTWARFCRRLGPESVRFLMQYQGAPYRAHIALRQKKGEIELCRTRSVKQQRPIPSPVFSPYKNFVVVDVSKNRVDATMIVTMIVARRPPHTF